MIVIMFEDIKSSFVGIDRRHFTFAGGETVFHLGDRVHLVHFVTSGAVHLVRHHEAGAPLVLQRAGPGAILAEASLYSDRYQCDALAIASTTIWAIPKPVILARLASTPDFALAWTRRQAYEVQRARLQAEIISMKTVAARLDAWMVWSGSMPQKGEWVGLAAEIGVSPEALYRELANRR